MTREVQKDTMRFVRFMFAIVIALGLGLSPVAAGMVQAKMVKCDHEMMMDEAMDGQSMDQGDCACCHDAAKCPPSACALKCFGAQAVLAVDAALLTPVRAQQDVEPAAIPRSLTIPPEPPPPRA